MALVSVQNILAPIDNKTHLFTIVIFAALFGLWRATGGSVSLEGAVPQGENPAFLQGSTVPSTTVQGTASQGAPNNGTSSQQQSRVSSAVAKSSGAHSQSNLDSLLKPSAPAQKPVKREPHRGSALDDIEKTLGMR